MQRVMAAYTVAAGLILALGIPAAHNVTAHTRLAHAARPADGVPVCGVERWRVKVGLDQDARSVNQTVVVVDLLITAQGPVAVDVNAFPGFRGVPGASSALGALVEQIGRARTITA